jgi:hypothetical protein
MTARTRPTKPVASDTIARLKAVAEPTGYIEDPSEIEPHCRSWRDNWIGKVPLVLRPRTTEQVAEIVRVCAAARVAVIPAHYARAREAPIRPGAGSNQASVPPDLLPNPSNRCPATRVNAWCSWGRD